MLSVLHPVTESSRRGTAVLLALCLLAGGCAASSAFHRADQAEQRQDYDLAVVEYAKALRLNPEDRNTRGALERSKLKASQDHFNRARRLSATGKFDQALVEYQVAAELNPSNAELDQELNATRNKLRAKIAVAREGKTELQTLMDRTRELPPPGMDLPTGVKMPASLTFRDAASRDVFTAISRLANISVIFDSTFRDSPVTVDLRNASLEDALTTVSGATRTFFRVTAPKTIVVIPDTPAKRREYEEEIVRTFYLSNADLKETMDLLRMVLDARRISPTTATNALTIKDSPERIAAASRVINAIDKARPEVIIDVELIEVDRTKLQEYGLQIASPGSPGINGSISIAEGASGISLSALRNLSQSDILLASLPSLYYRLLKSDTNTRTLANPQLRTTDGVAAQAKFGEQVPCRSRRSRRLVTGGVSQQPITSFNYQNIGVNIDITPRTHHDDDVSLQLKIAVTNISDRVRRAADVRQPRDHHDHPVARRRDEHAGRLDSRRGTAFADGLPGLSDLPLVGHLFGYTTKSITQTDIILTLTPHIIRVLDLTEADLRPFRVGRDSLAPLAELPLPPAEPPKPPELPKPDDPANPAVPIKKPGGKQ
jgi:general secretion pathway protein D